MGKGDEMRRRLPPGSDPSAPAILGRSHSLQQPRLGIVLAAGLGSRTGYMASLIPKTLIPVSGRPLLWHALSTLRRLGPKDARILLLVQPDIVRAYLRAFDPERNLGYDSVRIVVQSTPPRGAIDSLLRVLPKRLPDFALVLGDDLTLSPDVRSLSRIFYASDAEAAQLCVSEFHPLAIRQSCEVIPGPRNEIARIDEKPRQPKGHLRGCGVYLFRGASFSGLIAQGRREGRLRSLSDLIMMAAERRRAVFYETRGPNVNINTIGDVLTAWSITARSGTEKL